ncbi:hypothetical protein WT27_31265 [Burkholderia territorii]|uniref:Uncharacterized protein n=1 Tax=Burkholderia territorii TaxID=1503055 RepID=A0A106E8C9_9BURK|nr:hypothetical protein WT27_31265 [Burkholderia territorii]KVX42884.1 hypothetical protein WT31_27470 [Burkholderia territorii]
MLSFPGRPVTSLTHAEKTHESPFRPESRRGGRRARREHRAADTRTLVVEIGTRLPFTDSGGIAGDGHPVDLIDRPPTPRRKEFLKHVT